MFDRSKSRVSFSPKQVVPLRQNSAQDSVDPQSASPAISPDFSSVPIVSREIVQRDTPAFNSEAQLPSPSYVNGTPSPSLQGGGVASTGDSKFVGGESSQLLTASQKITSGLGKFADVAESIKKMQSSDKASIRDSANNIASAILGFSKGMQSLATGLDALGNKSANTQELKQFGNANLYVTRIVTAANTVAAASEASSALTDLQNNPSPENAKKWADSVTGLFTAAGGIMDSLPEGCIPGFMKDYYKGLFSAPANYVGAFETLMELHYGQIDKEAGLDHGTLWGIKRHEFAVQGEKTMWEGALVGVYVGAFMLPKAKDGTTFEDFMKAHREKEGPDLYDVSKATGKALLLVAVQRDAPDEVKQDWADYLGKF